MSPTWKRHIEPHLATWRPAQEVVVQASPSSIHKRAPPFQVGLNASVRLTVLIDPDEALLLFVLGEIDLDELIEMSSIVDSLAIAPP